MRCSRSDGVLYRRGERDGRGSAGWMRLGERDAAGHGRSGVHGLHGYANRATECAFGMPLMGTSPTGMPEAQRSARVAHPLMGRGCRRHAPQRRMRAAHNRVREVAGSPTTPCRGRRPDPQISQEHHISPLYAGRPQVGRTTADRGTHTDLPTHGRAPRAACAASSPPTEVRLTLLAPPLRIS